MNNSEIITHINHDDPRCKTAVTAENQLFDHYGLDYQVHFVELDEPNLRLRVLEVGEGRPLLMVPGGSGEAVGFAPLMAQLEGRRMIAINRPGAGMSDGIDHRQVNLRSLAVNSIRTVVEAFGLKRIPIVCNSMGGLWSFWYTLAYPKTVSSMVQMGCPALALDTSTPFFMRLLGVPFINRFIAPNMQPDSVEATMAGLRFQGSSQEDINRLPPVLGEACYHAFNLPTYLDTWKTLVAAITTITGANKAYKFGPDLFQQIHCPVQFIWGDNDPFGGLDVARQIVDMMPNARLHEMQAGHLPLLDKPEETGRIINQFLTRETVNDAIMKDPA
jgi:2-hydroxy-6-oxonona-2,4-dienedioate hydrolase